jgi:hypothetical protein
MRRTFLAIALVAIATLAMMVSAGGAQEQPPASTVQAPPPALAAKPTCTVTMHEYKWVLRHAVRYSARGGDYHARPIAHKAIKRLVAMRKCASAAEHHVMVHRWRVRMRRWHLYAYVDAITPFGKWAIPAPIVMCESGGSWRAANPSGAVGPYQLLGWGAPYPARTLAQKIRNHLIARSLYINKGSGPWAASSGCWAGRL